MRSSTFDECSRSRSTARPTTRSASRPIPVVGRVLSGGNFHGQPVALAMDFLKLAVTELASISERRTYLMLDPSRSGLPAFLSPSPGVESGFMVAQYTAAALVSENKVLAHPASADSIPTSAGMEDYVSMGPIAARGAAEIITNARRVVAIELLCAAQGVEQHEPLKPRSRRGGGDGATES